MNDLRPVALTPVPMKCLEKIVLSNMLPHFIDSLDPCQFAYKSKRSVEDAILFFTNNLYKHLDSPKCYVRTLFIDFSSAFNTIQPHILFPKLTELNVPNNLCLWILDFLTQRPQFVSLKLKNGCFQSSELVTNTGAPQGTVLAPILFSIYTNSCVQTFHNIPIIKYADDTSIQALIKSTDDVSNYFSEINRFTEWCDSHFLLLNVKKTKELIIDFRKINNQHDSVTIKGETVERVSIYKYLGVYFDENLDWVENSEKLLCKANQRLFFMRKLSGFKVNKNILHLFFEHCVMSLFYFCITAWGGNIRASERDELERCIRHCLKLFDHEISITLNEILRIACKRKLDCIIKDKSHPLFSFLNFSVRSGRLISIKTCTTRHLNSFLPLAVRHHNSCK